MDSSTGGAKSIDLARARQERAELWRGMAPYLFILLMGLVAGLVLATVGWLLGGAPGGLLTLIAVLLFLAAMLIVVVFALWTAYRFICWPCPRCGRVFIGKIGTFTPWWRRLGDAKPKCAYCSFSLDDSP